MRGFLFVLLYIQIELSNSEMDMGEPGITICRCECHEWQNPERQRKKMMEHAETGDNCCRQCQICQQMVIKSEAEMHHDGHLLELGLL